MDELEKETQLKKLFAARLLQIDRANLQDIFKVAQEFDPDNGKALFIATHWVNDVVVLQEIVELNSKGFAIEDKEKIKVELSSILMGIVRNEKLWPEDRIKAAKELGVISGIVQDNKVIVNNNATVQVNKVMVVKDFGSDEQWERKALAQQERLLNESKPVTVN